MKVAIPTEDRENVSEHFGRSPNFLVITVEGKEIVSREMRKKPGHEEFAVTETRPQTDEKGRHGFGILASKRHDEIKETIKDCELVIAGRIGLGAYTDMKNYGIKVVATDVEEIDKAIFLYLKDNLPHMEDRVC